VSFSEMVMLREEPPEKEEDDPEPEPDIVPSCGRDQQCHDREEKLFLFTAILCHGRETP
jgi:hypothetical protein